MKARFFCILIIIALCVCSFSFAEPFEVRNGIKFGMSPEEVRQIEEEVLGSKDPDIRTDEKTNKVTAIFYYDINIAGIEKGYVRYKFEDDKLTEIFYSWYRSCYITYDIESTHKYSLSAETQVYGELKQIYDTVNGALAQKYEQIGSYANGVFNHIDFADGNQYGYPVLFDYGDGQHTDVYGITQYITNDDNNYVEIVSACYAEFWNGSHQLKVEVRYRFVPEDKYNSLMSNTTDNQEKLNNDL